MRRRDLNNLRRQLEEWQARTLAKTAVNFMGAPRRNINDASDEMEFASRDAEESFRYRIHDRDVKLLGKIKEALERIDEGRLGICEDCEEPIAVERLRARPITTLCVQCKGEQEIREKTQPDEGVRYPTRSIISDWVS